MGERNTEILLQCMVLAMVMIAMVEEAVSIPICNIDTNDLEKCRAAVTGNPPPPPDKECCGVIRRADLTCLCKYKSALPSVGIDPAKAVALPAKCGLKNTPPECKA